MVFIGVTSLLVSQVFKMSLLRLPALSMRILPDSVEDADFEMVSQLVYIVPDRMFTNGTHLLGKDMDLFIEDGQKALHDNVFTPIRGTDSTGHNEYVVFVRDTVLTDVWPKHIPLAAKYHIVKWCIDGRIKKTRTRTVWLLSLLTLVSSPSVTAGGTHLRARTGPGLVRIWMSI